MHITNLNENLARDSLPLYYIFLLLVHLLVSFFLLTTHVIITTISDHAPETKRNESLAL